ncbi:MULTISPECIES: bifunctional pantoate--beta-alanine ligase/(d)CMP kinase [unclassified Coleofasciculus]|uniref:bifunctional pantoate--beta-alanine ligase/(d)CMP kinase n=1 Tax=unclassified Coleofasciculus TaxID=2692782 RepID=UPI0018822D5D|nr:MULTISPECIES: bifunctional pantoate--beta-alanine ligase/(d)CMP kinase [unclassified Coleofasciculus]MBE9125114.1 bifunctional pantoate--beta-alanine ligase/(d)CMP kinase [Coleofasciculus sp. LEGE 07081]MBE9148331.1 bifunctional pantoate--beta-alanine ligase/(d)CMP kinase [Coleofasciculus sp. LEGE 07092]
MRLFTTTAGLRCYLNHHRPGKDVGLVPTMGALHVGHFSLIERARRENTIVIVSIFVNPLQFGPMEDFQQYPRPLEQDRQLCEQVGVDAIFAPTAVELYGHHRLTSDVGAELTQVVPPTAMTSVLCGRFRPGHFQGVATVVTKLLNLLQPNRAYFGQKDAQQLAIIRHLVADLNVPVTIVGCPILREESGLAYSSRNQYLTESQKSQAPILYSALQQAQKAFQAGERDRTVLIETVKSELTRASDILVDYVELVDPTTLMPLDQVEHRGLLALAAHFGSTRLIDNILLVDRQPVVAIDGPAGAGKSTVTRLVAKALGLMHLDTGAMYRALTWRVMQGEIELEDEPAIAELVSQSHIYLTNEGVEEPGVRVCIDGEDVTQVIRSPEVTANVSAIAALPEVRRELVKQQQRLGCKGGIVAEGRDIGTHVFPDAELKIFLTASVQERAHRRQEDLKNQGHGDVSLEQLEHEIQQRDIKDSTRAIAPLCKAPDAIEMNTDGLTIAEVTAGIVNLYQERVSS